MQKIQHEIEEIGEVNSGLEQEFENELGKKNKNTTEVGKIIDSINNIYKTVTKLATSKKKQLRKENYGPEILTYEYENKSSS